MRPNHLAHQAQDRTGRRRKQKQNYQPSKCSDARQYRSLLTALLHEIPLGRQDDKCSAFIRGSEKDAGYGVQHRVADNEAQHEHGQDVISDGSLKPGPKDDQQAGLVIDVQSGKAGEKSREYCSKERRTNQYQAVHGQRTVTSAAAIGLISKTPS